jgi:hypothetical protein
MPRTCGWEKNNSLAVDSFALLPVRDRVLSRDCNPPFAGRLCCQFP